MRFNLNLPNHLTTIFKPRAVRQLVIGAAVAGLSGSTFSADAASDFVTNAHLPTDVYDRCAVSQETVQQWFNGDITANGWVDPADSTAQIFNPSSSNTRCDFYKWGAQMFLWLTSETGAADKHVFSQAPLFYDISSTNGGIGRRSFIADNGTMSLEPGAKTEIEFGEASDSDVLITQDGSIVYFGLHANDVFALYATAFNKRWLTSTDFPDSQADLDTLSDAIKAQSQVTGNPDYTGYLPILQSEALAMELKTSWVDASDWSPSKLDGYIHTEAVVPEFDTSNPKGPWPISGNSQKKLALIGMHVVGTVNGHPEMVWATFEHVNNAPANTYTYNTNNATTPATNTQAYDSSTNDWTLLPRGTALPTSIEATGQGVPCVVGHSPSPEQVALYSKNYQDIVQCGDSAIGAQGSISSQIRSKADPIADITKTDVARIDAWGGGTVANNTDLISLNKSVLTWLKPGDYRGNYIQTGGIWTSDGSVPTNGSQTDNPALVGSLKLANTTMETYDQIIDTSPNAFNPINCFGCHNVQPGAASNGVSHIFDAMKSLPPKSKAPNNPLR